MGQVSLSLIFLPFISATSPPEIKGISTYKNINQFKYIITSSCPTFKKIFSSTVSRLMKCFGLCGQTLNCYAVSYSKITSRCKLFTNEAIRSKNCTYFVQVEWEMLTILVVVKRTRTKIFKFRFVFVSWQTIYSHAMWVCASLIKITDVLYLLGSYFQSTNQRWSYFLKPTTRRRAVVWFASIFSCLVYDWTV